MERQLVKSPKYCWSDTGLALFLGKEEPRGEHFEHLVPQDLLAWQGAQSVRPELFYWRTSKGYEVDFIVQHGRTLLPIEVTATSQPSTGDMKSMQIFLGEYGERAGAGLILHTGDQTFWIAKNVLAVPWWRVI